MPNPLFDSAALAIVAYAHVNGTDGTSTTCTDNLTTSRVSQGVYALTLPTGLGQEIQNDLFIVTPHTTTALPNTGLITNPRVFDISSNLKEVLVGTASTALDCDFDVLILRTTLPRSLT